MWKKAISLFLVLFILPTLIGCGGITTPGDDESSQYNDSSQDFIFIKNINPENNVVGTVTENTFVKNEEIGTDIIAILGEKDSFGNSKNLTGAIYILEEDALEIIANNKGLATSLKDLQRNVIVFENYTNYTVDISIFDSNGNLILEPTISEIDPYELEEVQKYYLSGEEIEKFKWAAKIFGYTACTASVVADIYTVGGLTPLVLKVCGSVLIKEVLDATTTDADNMLYTSASLIECGSAFSGPSQFIGCVGSITDVIAEVSENPNQPPTINSLSAESTYIKPTETVEITSYVDDPDETENFSFSWSSPDGGDFIAMPYIYQPNLPSWESNVPWKCSSTIIWTAPDSPGIYVINCTVIDKEGEMASDSISIEVFGENHAPVISSLNANPSNVDINQTTSITCTASDEDVGDTLTYTWTKNGGIFEGDTSGSSVTWKAPSTKGNYTVTCKVSDGVVSDSESVNISVGEPTPVSAPTGVDASDGTYTDKVKISWDSVTDASYYKVYRATSSGGTKTAITSWQTSTYYYNSVTSGTYYYFVKAATSSSGANASGYSSYDTGYPKPPSTTISAPTGVLASDGTYTDKIYITWNSVSEASYYKVWRATSSGGAKTAITSWQSSRYYSDYDVIPGDYYYYFVKAATSSSGANASPSYSSYNRGHAEETTTTPTVTTLEAYTITKTAATLWGEIVSTGGLTVTRRGFEYKDSAGGSTFDWHEDGDWSANDYIHRITGLVAGHTYLYRAYAVNDKGTGYGAWESFKTTEEIITSPSVTTVGADNIQETSIRFKGRIDDTGGEDADWRGFRIEDTVTGWIYSPRQESGPYGTGDYYITYISLTPGHTYKYKACAHNSAGTSYGTEKSVTTQVSKQLISIESSISSVSLKYGQSLMDNEYDITAYYSNGSSADIWHIYCTWSSSKPDVVYVNEGGMIIPLVKTADFAIITMTYTEGGITKSDTIAVTVLPYP